LLNQWKKHAKRKITIKKLNTPAENVVCVIILWRTSQLSKLVNKGLNKTYWDSFYPNNLYKKSENLMVILKHKQVNMWIHWNQSNKILKFKLTTKNQKMKNARLCMLVSQIWTIKKLSCVLSAVLGTQTHKLMVNIKFKWKEILITELIYFLNDFIRPVFSIYFSIFKKKSAKIKS